MRKLMLGLGALALGLVLVASRPAYAETHAKEGTQTGTVIAVEEEVVKIKGADGKEYEVDLTIVAAEDLKTGDMVEYGIVNEKPTRVKKKK